MGIDDSDKRARIASSLGKIGLKNPGVCPILEELGLKDGRLSAGITPENFMKCLAERAPITDQAETEERGDERTLAIERMVDGSRSRDFKATAAVMLESSWADWPS